MIKMADKVYINAKIYSIDESHNTYEALGIKDGLIDFLGKNSDIESRCNEFTEIVDLKGKTILPAFADSHTHAPGLAYDILFNVNLYDAMSAQETLDKIQSFVASNPNLDLYYGRGFNASFFEGLESVKGPRKEHLDRISSTKPIILSDFGGNYFWMNTKAFEKYNISNKTLVPNDGIVEIDDETGEIWGILREGARVLVPYQTFTSDQNYQAAKWFQNLMSSFGYTSILAFRPPGTVEPRTTAFEIFKVLEEKGELNLRVQGARDMSISEDIDTQLDDMLKVKKHYDSPLIKFTTAKFFLDGVVESGTGFLLEPYLNVPGKSSDYKGYCLWEHNKLTYAFQRCMEEGFQIHCHSIGDGAVNAGLNALEAAFNKMGLSGIQLKKYRNTFTHLQLVSGEDINRMAKLNVIAGVQPYWHFKSPTMWWALERPLLGQRADTQYPLASLINSGVTIVSSSDYPVTPKPNPFYAIQAGVTRNLYNSKSFNLENISDIDDPMYLLNKYERVNPYEMIKSYTVNAAYAKFDEENAGSLEVGKFADFIVIDKDPFEVNALEIENIKILETIFNGKTVYSLCQKN